MSDLVERLRARQESRYHGGSQDHGWYADELCQKAAAEIERLTADLNHALTRAEIAEAQRDTLRAKLAQYEQAPVVGWVCDDFIQDPCGSASCHNCGKRRREHIIFRPEAKPLGAAMSDLIERFRKLQADAGIPHLPTELTYECRMAVSGEGPRAFDWSDKPHRLVYDLSREVERLTAERDAARAKLAQYEQAPVVGWLTADGRISSDETKRTAMAKPSRDAFHIPLIARPEANHDAA